MKKRAIALLLCIGMVFGNFSAVIADEGITPSEEEVYSVDPETAEQQEPDYNEDDSQSDDLSTQGEEYADNPVTEEESSVEDLPGEESPVPGEEAEIISDTEQSEEPFEEDDSVSDDGNQADAQQEILYDAVIYKAECGSVCFSDRMTLPEQGIISDESIEDLRAFAPGTEIILEVYPEEGYELQDMIILSGSAPEVQYNVQMNEAECVFIMPEDSISVTAFFTEIIQEDVQPDNDPETGVEAEEESVISDGEETTIADDAGTKARNEADQPVLKKGLSDADSNGSSGEGRIPIESVSLSEESFNYTGEAIEPEVTVTCQGTTLEKDVDYTVSYENNIEVGTATAIVTGINNYEGTLTATFEIIAEMQALRGVSTIASGTCSDGLTWRLTSDGWLNISGIGDIGDMYNNAPWHQYRNTIKKITINSGVTSIGDYAFSGCSSLSRIELPEGVTSIGDFAFIECSSLSSIELPEGVTSIGHSAFECCSSLSRIELPEGVTSIGDSLFDGCSSLKTAGPIGSGCNIEFGWSSSIPENAFSECKSLNRIELPEGVTSIGACAFYDCWSLNRIELPEGVTSIGYCAFYDCSSLQYVYYDGTLAEWNAINIASGNDILKNAKLYYSYNIAYVMNGGENNSNNPTRYYRDNIESIILEDPFREGCTFCGWYRDSDFTDPITEIPPGSAENLTLYAKWVVNVQSINISQLSLTIEAGETVALTVDFNPAYATNQNISWESSNESAAKVDEGTIQAVAPGKAVITATSEDGGHTAECEVTVIRYPEQIRFEQEAFSLEKGEAHSALGIVFIPEDTTERNVTWFSLDDTVLGVDKNGSLTALGNGTATLKAVSHSCEAECLVRVDTSPRKITIKKHEISLLVGETAPTLELEYEPEDTTLTDISWSSSDNTIVTVNESGEIEAVSAGTAAITAETVNGLTDTGIIHVESAADGKCGDNAWYKISGSTLKIFGYGNMYDYNWSSAVPWYNQRSQIQYVEISEGIEGIGEIAFSNCSNIKRVIFPESLKTIGDYAFSSCTSLDRVTIPDSVTSIGEYAFQKCTGMSFCVLSENLESLGRASFYNCTALTGISLPGTLTAIGDYAFQGCVSLADVAFADGIKEIGAGAFYGDTDLISVELPSSVESIGSSAFKNCTALTAALLPDNLISIGSDAFSGCTDLENISLPAGLTEIGNSAFYGCESLKSMVMPSNIKSIPYALFSGCVSLENVSLPHWAESVGNNAFYNCRKLQSAAIPQNVKSIGEKAFSNCSSLESVTIPDSVTAIGEGAFSGCSSLQTVSLSDNITRIEKDTFNGCTWLSEISIPDSTVWIGQDAFRNCTRIKSIAIPEGMKQISSGVFYGDTSLRTIYLPLSLSSIDSYAFTNAASGIDVYYAGIEAEWQKVSGYNNSKFVLHYNYGYADSISFEDDSITLGIGARKQLVLVAAPEGAEQRAVVWESSNSRVVSVDENGLITAIKAGKATIFADAENGLSTSCDVIVTDVELTGISLTQESLDLDIGDSFTLSVVTAPDNASVPNVSWDSSNTDVITVDNNGTLTAVSRGKSVITAATENGLFSAECSVEVFDKIESVSIEGESLNLEVGDVVPAPAIHYDPDEHVNPRDIKWSSSDERVLKIGEDNSISAVGEGTAELTVTVNGVSAAIPAAVHFPAELSNLVKERLKIFAGETGSVCTVEYSGLSAEPDHVISWSSSDESVAIVNNGKVYGVGRGEAIVTAETDDGKTAACIITVLISPDSLQFNSDRYLLVGNALQLIPVVSPENADLDEMKWSTSNPAAATVEQDGTVTGLSEGTAVITLSASGFEASCEINVVKDWTYSVVFSANGGSGSMAPLSGLKGGNSYYLSENTFTRRGYSFNYWTYTDINGVTQRAYEDVPVTDLGAPGATVVLEANWHKTEVPNISIHPQSNSVIYGYPGANAAVYAEDGSYRIYSYSLKKGSSVIKQGTISDCESAAYRIDLGALEEEGTYVLTWVSRAFTAYNPRLVHSGSGYSYIYDYAWSSPAATYTKYIVIRNSALPEPDKVSLAGADILLDKNVYSLENGKAVPAVSVKLGDITLIEGRDYTVSYKNNNRAGEAIVTVSGTGRYEGSASRSFWVTERAGDKISLFNDDTEVSGLEAKTYNGKAQILSSLVVKIGTTVLTEGTDYTVSYRNNTNAGNANVLITGKGLFKDTLEPEFQIRPRSVYGATVSGITDQVYTGRPQAQSITVKTGDMTLTEGTDYQVSYQNNTNAGTASLTITGKGNFTASETVSFNIKPKSLDSAVIENIAPQAYTAGGAKPDPIVQVDEVRLENGTDYTLSYKNNTRIGKAEVTVSGKGNYTGEKIAGFDVLFTDVPSTHSFSKAVYWAVDAGIAAGYSGAQTGLFGINDSITRGQVVTFLWRAAGKPEPRKNTQTFTDVPTGHAFYKAIQWASEMGITGGYTGSRAGQFGPNDPCTRGQIATFLWRYAGKPAPKKNTQTFSDVPVTHSFYKSIQWASENGITAGYSDGTFGVNRTCTRGHCVTFLYRLLK